MHSAVHAETTARNCGTISNAGTLSDEQLHRLSSRQTRFTNNMSVERSLAINLDTLQSVRLLYEGLQHPLGPVIRELANSVPLLFSMSFFSKTLISYDAQGNPLNTSRSTTVHIEAWAPSVAERSGCVLLVDTDADRICKGS